MGRRIALRQPQSTQLELNSEFLNDGVLESSGSIDPEPELILLISPYRLGPRPREMQTPVGRGWFGEQHGQRSE
jgi:hypothetical protein